MDAFLAGLVAGDAVQARLASGARYTENGQELPVGDGAWATIDAVGPYRHDFIDVESGTVATMVTAIEGLTRSILVVRLQIQDGTVTEIEAFLARPDLTDRAGSFAGGALRLDESGGPDSHWFAPVPADERMSRAELEQIADAYFSGIERNDGRGWYPFADDCVRIENGYRTTGTPAPAGAAGRDPDTPYTHDFKTMTARQQLETGFFAFVDRIRDRRFPVIDAELGVVFAFAFFDHSGTIREYALRDGTPAKGIDRPFSWEIGEAFKIERGLMTRIEAVMTACPYGMRAGWT